MASGDAPSPAAPFSPSSPSSPLTIRRTASSQSVLQAQQSGPLSLQSAASSATSASGWQSTQDRLNEILEVRPARLLTSLAITTSEKPSYKKLLAPPPRSTPSLRVMLHADGIILLHALSSSPASVPSGELAKLANHLNFYLGLSPGRTPIMPSERVPALSDHGDEPDERTSFVAARNTMNYQSTQTASSLRSRQPVQPEVDPAGHNGSAARDADADANADAEEKRHWLWNSLDGVWSFELENKGSVARDHLAVERTFLAWLRTSLAFASIGIAITQLFRLNASLANEQTNQHFRRLGKPLGTAFIGISILVLLLGYQRFYQPQQWLLKGKFPASRGPIVLISLVSFALMVVSLVVVLVVQPPDMHSSGTLHYNKIPGTGKRDIGLWMSDTRRGEETWDKRMSLRTRSVDIPAFASTQLALLDAELQSELQETSGLIANTSPTSLQRAGLAITNLVVSSQRTGLGGRTVLELSPDSATAGAGGELPEHGVRTGDIVLVSEQPAGSAKKREIKDLEKKGARGVVTKIKKDAVYIAADEDKEDALSLSGRVWLVKLADDVTYRRMNLTMEKLQKMTESEYSSFIRVLFGLSSPSPVPPRLDTDPEFEKMEWLDPTLNDSQKDAIRFALASREVALIHGPPGTGKTHTLIELILQMVKRGLRVLVCGPSNISVDNIVERLSPHKIPILRLGHPARLLPSVLDHSLDVLTQTSEAGLIVRDVRSEMDAKQASIKKTKSGRERKAIYGDLKELRKEFRERERRCVNTLVKGSKVVLATLHGAGGYQLKNEEFDVIVIDEASQALEAQCWVPLLAAKKAVCAGDHLQLPPTVKSTNSKIKPKLKEGESSIIKGVTLETTLFDRLLSLHGSSIKRMLTTQYRMHEAIMRFPSDQLYESKLIAAEAVKYRLLKDLPYDVEDTEDTNEPVIFIDTQGGDFPEKNEEDAENVGKKGSVRSLYGESKSNEMEAALVRQHVRKLVHAGVKPEDIAVVTPYNAQLGLLAPLKDAFPGIELGSVDGFQGREKEAVIVSLVRSNAEGEVGFLSEKRRLNGEPPTLLLELRL
ncbi:hypothetical protein GQX73_g9188 [Xylaria multiplex]|uniref:DNA helicase n=1 Tax=Xylaria multiplex TaxID=323545 RepID=A0A7C8MMX1_9PEZI|nr:hypothetical protein GQX73_g9188 [Xylaria multiplex]